MGVHQHPVRVDVVRRRAGWLHIGADATPGSEADAAADIKTDVRADAAVDLKTVPAADGRDVERGSPRPNAATSSAADAAPGTADEQRHDRQQH